MLTRSQKTRLAGCAVTMTISGLANSTLICLTGTMRVCANELQETIRFEQRHHGLRSHCSGFHYQSDVEPWLGRCEQDIRKVGFEEKMFKGRKLEIQIDLKDNIASPHISKSSGSAAVDRAALELLIRASPFELPELALPRDRPLFAEFDYPRLELKFRPLARADARWVRDPYVPESAKYASYAHY